MSDDLEDIFKRINYLEKQVFSLDRQMTSLEAERPIDRLTRVEIAVEKVSEDMLRLEKISKEMSEGLSSSLERLELQAAQIKGYVRGSLAVMVLVVGAVNLWPTLKEILRSAL